jgi:hypothetical protein
VSCLSFGFSLAPPSSDWYRMTCSLYLSSVEKFWPTPLYKASMYIDSAFFFTQQFTLYSCSRSQRYSLWHSSVLAFLDTSQVSPLLVLHSAGRQMRSLRTTKIHTVRFSLSTVQEFQVHSRLPRRQHSRPRLLRLRRVKSTVPKRGVDRCGIGPVFRGVR